MLNTPRVWAQSHRTKTLLLKTSKAPPSVTLSQKHINNPALDDLNIFLGKLRTENEISLAQGSTHSRTSPINSFSMMRCDKELQSLMTQSMPTFTLFQLQRAPKGMEGTLMEAGCPASELCITVINVLTFLRPRGTDEESSSDSGRTSFGYFHIQFQLRAHMRRCLKH